MLTRVLDKKSDYFGQGRLGVSCLQSAITYAKRWQVSGISTHGTFPQWSSVFLRDAIHTQITCLSALHRIIVWPVPSVVETVVPALTVLGSLAGTVYNWSSWSAGTSDAWSLSAGSVLSTGNGGSGHALFATVRGRSDAVAKSATSTSLAVDIFFQRRRFLLNSSVLHWNGTTLTLCAWSVDDSQISSGVRWPATFGSV